MHGIRSATGVLVLSTALLIGSTGAATAFADTAGDDSTSSSARTDGTSAGNSSSISASNSVTSLRDSVTTALRGSFSPTSRADDSTLSPVSSEDVDDAVPAEDGIESLAGAEESDDVTALGALVESDEPEQAENQATPVAVSTGTDSKVTEDPAPARAASVATSDNRDGGTADVFSAGVTSAAGDSPAQDDLPAGSVAVTAQQNVPTGQGKPFGNLAPDSAFEPEPLVTSLATMVTTMQTVVVSLGSAAAAIPPAIWALPFSQTPFSDVVALLETVLSSVEQSVTAMAQLPSNFVALFGMPTVTGADAPGIVGIGESSDHRLLPVLDSFPVAGSPVVAPLLGQLAPLQTVDDFVSRMGFAAFSPAALAALAAPVQIGPTSIPALAGEYESLFDRAFGALLVPLSLWALATGALPGLVGLLVVFGAGARVGYRQAKAGLALKVAGLARFAGPGPLGVVRSGSFVVLHQRGVRTGGTRIPRWSPLGDQAA